MPGVSQPEPMGHMQPASCFLNKVLLENSPAFSDGLSMTAFKLQQPSRVVGRLACMVYNIL